MTDETNQSPEAETETPKAKKRQMGFHVLEDGTVQATFGEGVDPLTLNPAAIPEALQAAAMTEGLISRARGYTSKLTEKERTPENLKAAVQKAFANLLAGVWKMERASTSGETAEFSMEVEAAFLFRKLRAESKGEEFSGTIEDAAANFAALSDDDKKKLKSLPRYQLAYAQVKEARAAIAKAKLEKKIAESEDDSEF